MSNSFRIAVSAHLTALYLLTFVMRSTLFGFWHNVAAVVLTALMALITVLFVIDMATQGGMERRCSKLIDGFIGSVWIGIVGVLILNSWRAGTP